MAFSFDLMFCLATAALAWGLSLASYRWIAQQSGWTMGAWQARMPVLPRTIGVVAVAIAVAFAMARGLGTALVLPLLGLAGAMAWTLGLKVGAQSALLLAPAAAALVLVGWRLGAV
jgi:hypothetical protein